MLACQSAALAEARTRTGEGASPAVYLRAHLVALIGGGPGEGSAQATNPLSPLFEAPCAATMTYLLFEGDESILIQLYPALRERVLRLFDEGSTAGGLVARSLPGASSGDIYLSPAVNALANLELHSLGLIAERIGRYEEALELITWSRELSKRVARSFYDPAREGFFPISPSGRFVTTYAPHQLLPLLLDREIGETMRERMLDGFIRHSRDGADGDEAAEPQAAPPGDPTIRLLLRDLLADVPGVDDDRLALLDPIGYGDAAGLGNAAPVAHWTAFWRANPRITARLFTPRTTVQGLLVLSKLLARESLLNPGDDRRFVEDVESIERELSTVSIDLAGHKRNIAAVNRCLAAIANLREYLEADSRLWKVVDETRWRGLSPRTRKLVVASCSLAIDELLFAKVALSETLTRSTGIVARASLPEEPVPIGTALQIETLVASRIDSLSISNVYAQIDDTRWNLTGEGELLPIAPWTTPLAVRKTLPVRPGTEPGLASFAVVFDFKHDGSRVEIHHRASVGFVRGHHATIRFPGGRLLGNGPVAAQIVLQYRPERDLQGTLEGAFLKDIRCSPALPARFVARAGTGVTTLPIEISCTDRAPPGVYPLTFSLDLGGEPIAVFEETVVRPFRWLYLGGLANSGITADNALYYQDNLFDEHPTASGRVMRWRELPERTMDGEGRILPERIPGVVSNSRFLLYTMIDAPAAATAIWRLATDNAASLWINGDLVFSSDDSAVKTRSGPIALREGVNAILVAVRGGESFAPVSFELGDQSGLPVPGIGNEFERLIDGYHRLDVASAPEVSPREPETLRADITLNLRHPGAEEVCVVGTFNNWEAGANPMKRGAGGVWSVTLSLPSGRYAYKFVVDRSAKIADPSSAMIEPDGFGGFNSIIVVK